MLSNVIIKVENFYYTIYFLVLDTYQSTREEQPTIILGHLFIATANAQIDFRAGEMGISFGNQQSRINIFNASSSMVEEHECYQVDILDELV